LQHHHVEVVRLKSALMDLQRRLAGHDRELSLLAEANGRSVGRALAEEDSQLEGPRGAMGDVTKKH
jgi:hypothetical protein